MISVLEAIPVLEMPSSVFRKAMATAETATTTAMATATGDMAAAEMAATTEMTATTTKASTMPATKASTMAASSAVSECCGGRNRQNTGQNQTGKETVK